METYSEKADINNSEGIVNECFTLKALLMAGRELEPVKVKKEENIESYNTYVNNTNEDDSLNTYENKDYNINCDYFKQETAMDRAELVYVNQGGEQNNQSENNMNIDIKKEEDIIENYNNRDYTINYEYFQLTNEEIDIKPEQNGVER